MKCMSKVAIKARTKEQNLLDIVHGVAEAFGLRLKRRFYVSRGRVASWGSCRIVSALMAIGAGRIWMFDVFLG